MGAHVLTRLITTSAMAGVAVGLWLGVGEGSAVCVLLMALILEVRLIADKGER